MLIGLQRRFRERVRLIHAELAPSGFELFTTHRSPEKQHDLFMRGGITRADAWQSAHQNRRLARIDALTAMRRRA